jgi:PleD family two-component response regulator
VQELVEGLGVRNPGSSIDHTMTVSQGAATALPDSKGTWSSLLHEADRALYRAKQMGRARIALGEPRTREELEGDKSRPALEGPQRM